MKDKTMVEFEKFYIEYKENIFRVCFLILKDYQSAEDAAQEAFYKALCSYKRFNGKSAVKTWITRIAVNVCKDKLKKKSSYETSDEDLYSLSYQEEYLDDKLSVIEAVKALPLKLREVVILYYYQELTHKEIAEILGISVPNTAYRLREAKSKLKIYLSEEEDYE
jgi:RNA polymerase sigma-70 factor (ECF subfamily)